MRLHCVGYDGVSGSGQVVVSDPMPAGVTLRGIWVLLFAPTAGDLGGVDFNVRRMIAPPDAPFSIVPGDEGSWRDQPSVFRTNLSLTTLAGGFQFIFSGVSFVAGVRDGLYIPIGSKLIRPGCFGVGVCENSASLQYRLNLAFDFDYPLSSER